jgi:hypothetical protein
LAGIGNAGRRDKSRACFSGEVHQKMLVCYIDARGC